MNAKRHFRARGARGSVRVTLLALACLCALVAGLGRFAAQPSSAANAQETKFPTVKRKATQVETQQPQTAKPAKGAKTLAVVPASTSCPNKTPISPGQTINGTLSSSDCPLGDGTFYDEYTFQATAGQTVSVSLSSDTFDTYLFLLKPSETFPTSNTLQNDDGGTGGPPGLGNRNSRIPANSGTITLPETGTYSILANAFGDINLPSTGPYSVTLTFGSTGGTICPPNPTPINNGQTVVNGQTYTQNGALTASDCTLQDGTSYDEYSFVGTAGQQVAITMTASGSLNAYLILLAPDGVDIAEDGATSTPLPAPPTNARIPTSTGFATLPQTGTYLVFANSAGVGQFGTYTLNLSVATTNCSSTAINIGQTINGTLATSDCRLPADGSFIDVYTFNGTAGQQIAITETPANFNAFLFLLNSTGSDIADDGPTSNPPPAPPTTARIPGPTGFFTLPACSGSATTCAYTIIANSALPNQTGNYTLSLLASTSCTYTLAQPSASIPAAGGSNFTVGVMTQAGCDLTTAQVTSNNSFITVNSITANGGGSFTVNYSVFGNTASTGRTGTITIAGQTFTVNQAANCSYAIYPTIRPFRETGGTNGRLTVVVNNGTGTSTCGWSAASDASWITITAGATGTGTGRIRYNVAANPDTTTRVGHINVNGGGTTFVHTVTQTAAGTTPTVQLSAATYTVAENDAANAAVITVTRTGDTTGAVTVEYSTVDDPAAVPCDPTATTQRGTAYARCDYATTVDTLTFQPGDTTKTFKVPLINDVHVEGDETVQVKLANPEGATLGTQQTATLTITDNDTVQPTTNPINQSPFFIRLQYLDFLSREPDTPGFNAYLNLLNGCQDVNNIDPNAPSAACDRITVSTAFFGSPEYQLKGTFVFLFEKVAFGSAGTPNFVPKYVDFATDLRRVTGSTAAEVFAKRLDFTEDFVNRAAFITRYNGMTNADYVDTLLANVGATLAAPDPNSGVTRNSLVNDLNTGAKTRADVLRAIVESVEVNQKQFNSAFVAAQYYGYLRRTPDAPGYAAWFNYLATHPTDSRTMVNGFVNSAEYRLRFGPNVGQ